MSYQCECLFTTSDRDDLLQDIAIALWQALPRFRGECSERTFLFRIAHNRVIAHLSRNRYAVQGVDEELELSDPRPDPEVQLAAQQQGNRLMEAVRRLPVIGSGSPASSASIWPRTSRSISFASTDGCARSAALTCRR